MSPNPPAPPLLNWSNSYWIVLLMALCIGLSTVLISLTIDRFIHGEFRHIYASDWLVALFVSALTGLALLRMQARRRELLVRMQIVEDVNHHVRNALTSIVFSASLREDPDLNVRISEACARIDWVLTEVLSKSIDASELQRRHPEWRSGRKL